MLGPKPTPVRCSSCGAQNTAEIRTVIDNAHDPQGKILLVSGQLNGFDCANCGTYNEVKTPILYHDASKELLIAFVPQEIGIQKNTDEEKIIGDLLNELTSALPKEDFRGYMFNPKRTLTLQGMINQILEADGITQEMLEAQQKRVDLIQNFIETDPNQLEALIQENDDLLDEEFFATFASMSARLQQSGQVQLAAILDTVQDVLIQHSTYGKEMLAQQEKQQAIIEAVTTDLEALGEDAEKKDFLKLLWDYRGDDDKVEAMVGLMRPLFDYEFFQMMAGQISKAPADERPKLEELRDQVYELTRTIDEQSRAFMQQVAQLLQAIVLSPEPEKMIRENLSAIDDNFMMVLNVNLQEAQKRNDQETFQRLQDVHEIVVRVLREHMQPELRFVNDLLNIDDDDQLIAELHKEAPNFGDTLLDVLDAVQEVVTAQGQIPVVNRIKFIRSEVEKVLS